MKLADIFETEPCRRCGGSGRYSYNQKDGDICYGCTGAGVQYTKRSAPFVDRYRAMVKAQKTVLTMNVRPGDMIAEAGKKWRTVASLADAEPWNWTKADGSTGSVPYFTVTFENGDSERLDGRILWYRRMTDAVRADLRAIILEAVDAGVATYDAEAVA